MSTPTSDPTDATGLSAFLPQGQQILASCFDAHHTIGGGLFSVDGAVEALDRVSSSGLTVDGSGLYRCLWSADGSPAELVVYDDTGIRSYRRLDGVSAPHDLLVVDGDVLVVATNENEIRCVSPEGGHRWSWTAPGERDSWHLNSLALYRGEVVVCGFGPYLRRRGWDENGRPDTGRVVELSTGRPVLEGLRAPHNPLWLGDTWFVCDSAGGELLELEDGSGATVRRVTLPGWPRGLAVTDDHVFVGLSPHRHAATSVESAAVGVVDRHTFEVRAVVPLPAREVYALALAPDELVEGARRGFDTNASRRHEQEQRRLFTEMGSEPRQLWAVGDRLASEECRAEIVVDDELGTERAAAAGSLLGVTVTVRNTGNGFFTPAPPNPVRVVHTWHGEDGEPVETQTITASLTRTLPPQGVLTVPVRARVPAEPGRYRLRITLAQDEGVSFDESGEHNALDLHIVAGADRVNPASLARFGLYAAEVGAALRRPTTEDMVAALFTDADGAPRRLVAALVHEHGVESFLAALAEVLGCSVAPLRHAVDQALPAASEVILSGAEAVSLGLARNGVTAAFTYAGTSELVVCDAMARLGLLVNGRGDREALFEAGGASRVRPATGAAVLHGARGLTNALGALADLRRNEIGTVAVVGLPSTGSAPFLPPHGEDALLSTCGLFAKSWYQAGKVPTDPSELADSVAELAGALTTAVRDARTRPYGPTLLGLPQDVAEKAWVPLLSVPPREDSEPAPADAEALAAASELVRAGRRPLVLLDDYALTAPQLRPALAEFCARTGAPVLQVKYRRGAMFFERLIDIDVPGFAGWYDPKNDGHRAMLDAADLIVTVEDRNMYPRVIGPLPDCPKIAVTSKPEAVRKNGYLAEGDVLLHGDVAGTLASLTAAGSRAGDPGEQRWSIGMETEPRVVEPVPDEAAAVRGGIAETIADLARTRERVLLLDDSQMFGGMLSEEYDRFPSDLRVFGGHGGFVGCGVPLATGLALGEPSATVLGCLGDQGFTNSMQGLVTAVQEQAPVVFLVCNNGGAVSLRKQSRPSHWLDEAGDRYLDNAEGMDYTRLAEAFGLRSTRIDLTDWLDRAAVTSGLEAFRAALGAAVDAAGPSLIELVLPSEPRFWSGVWINEGFEAPAPAPEKAGV